MTRILNNPAHETIKVTIKVLPMSFYFVRMRILRNTKVWQNPAQLKLLVVLINQWLPRLRTLLLLINPKMRNLLFQLRFQESILAIVRNGS
jgi:hypothetical protein